MEEDNKNKSLDLLGAMSELNEKVEKDSDPLLKEARDSIEMASKIINLVMNGKHIDMAFFKQFAANKQERAKFLKQYSSNIKKQR